jgi:undecaprenyl-phosphate galactose phosphotransferase
MKQYPERAGIYRMLMDADVAELVGADRPPDAVFDERRRNLFDIKEGFANVICATVLLTADVLAVLLASMVAMALISAGRTEGLLMPSQFSELEHFSAALPEFLLICFWTFMHFFFKGHYTRRIPFWTETKQIMQASAFALLGTGFLEFVFHTSNSRLLLVGLWIFFGVFAIIFRLTAKTFLAKNGLWQLNILLVGNDHGIATASAALASDELLGYRVVGELTMEQLPNEHPTGSFQDLLDAHRASRLVLALDVGSEQGRRVVKAVVRQGVPFSLVPQIENVPVFGYDHMAFFGHDTVMLSYRKNVNRPLLRGMKVVLDLTGAAFLLALLAPAMLLIAFCVRLDGGGALFAQNRVGHRGRLFRCFKFRTMSPDADKLLRDLLARDPVARAEWAETQKLSVDPRITAVGRFLRATSLDELPQLFNVMRLEMSLVGPRPIVPDEIRRYEEDISYYFETKPGLTGLWQVSGRSQTTYARRVQLDSWYVRNWSVWHDLAILMKTVPAVVWRRGAR